MVHFGTFQGLWVWTADHDLDAGPQITLWTGRGIMTESQGPVWMVGTASEWSSYPRGVDGDTLDAGDVEVDIEDSGVSGVPGVWGEDEAE